MKNTCMHSRAHGSDADSVVPLYLPSTHWQLADPVALVKLCSGQDAHGSLLCPSLNVPLGHSVKEAANTYHSTCYASIAYHISPNQIQSRTVKCFRWFRPAYKTSLSLAAVHLCKIVCSCNHTVYTVHTGWACDWSSWVLPRHTHNHNPLFIASTHSHSLNLTLYTFTRHTHSA